MTSWMHPTAGFFGRFLASMAVILAVELGAAGAVWAAGAAPAANSDLALSLESAASRAKASDDLDPAYELVGIAGAAHQQGQERVALSASNTFVDLVGRASKAAAKTGGEQAQDVLDQLVDLRAFARSTNILTVQVALDDGMRVLFPLVAAETQRNLETAATWEEKLPFMGDLAYLHAQASQVNLEDMMRQMAAAFDASADSLGKMAAEASDAAERARLQDEIAAARKSHDEQVKEAVANNINVVAAQMQSTEGRDSGGDRPLTAASPLPLDLAAAPSSCVEVALPEPPDAVTTNAMARDCAVSGRMPTEGRCPTANLSYVCLMPTVDGAQATYIYRGSADEAALRQTCVAANLTPAPQVPMSGIPFGPQLSVTFTCAPTGARAKK